MVTRACREVYLDNETATVAFGRALGDAVHTGAVIFLLGDLGAGKTTLSRGVLRAFGHSGAVKSPTYTLVEPYQFAGGDVNHFDLYRLGDPEELEYMGIRDYFCSRSLCLVEWPERGAGYLPRADLQVTVSAVPPGRRVVVEALTERGEGILARLTY